VGAEVEKLEAEHTATMEKWSGLPPHLTRARQKAEEQMAALESRIESLRQQQQDAGEVVAKQWQEILDLQRAVREARASLHTEAGERALLQRAAALRAVVQCVECRFRATGAVGSGWGRKSSELVKVTVFPVAGEAVAYPAGGVLLRDLASTR
jgi:hypothetical protein